MIWTQYEEQATGDHIVVGHHSGAALEPDVIIRVEKANAVNGADLRSSFAAAIAGSLRVTDQ